jgi:DNA-3-methyladenine glycosylase II
MRESLDRHNIGSIASELAFRDPLLRTIYESLGTPPLWKRSANFATLVQIVLEQQVSLSSAKATFNRLKDRLDGRVSARRLSGLDELELRQLGFSRQKSRYCLLLAAEVHSRRFSVAGLARLDDHQVREKITSLIGFGDWSADVFLLMALCRTDIFPIGDLALVVGASEVTEQQFSTPTALLEYAERWRPYRSVATRMIWHSYLQRRGRSIS